MRKSFCLFWLIIVAPRRHDVYISNFSSESWLNLSSFRRVSGVFDGGIRARKKTRLRAVLGTSESPLIRRYYLANVMIVLSEIFAMRPVR